MFLPSKHISVCIQCEPSTVYEFVTNPKNLSRWASGVTEDMDLRFIPRNELGVMDHVVTLQSGESFYNPFRVFRNDDGAEVLFTLHRHPQVGEEEFWADQDRIYQDLMKLKSVLESERSLRPEGSIASQ